MTTEEPRPPRPTDPAKPPSGTGLQPAGHAPPSPALPSPRPAVPRQTGSGESSAARPGAAEPASPQTTSAEKPPAQAPPAPASAPRSPDTPTGPRSATFAAPVRSEVERAAALAAETAIDRPAETPAKPGRPRFLFFGRRSGGPASDSPSAVPPRENGEGAGSARTRLAESAPPAAVRTGIGPASEPFNGVAVRPDPPGSAAAVERPGKRGAKEPLPTERPPGAPVDPWTAFATAPERPPGPIQRASRAFLRSFIHEYALAIYAGLLLAVALTWPTLRYPLHTLPQDLGDPARQAWQISWIGHVLLTHPQQLWQSNAFYPEPNSYAFGDSLLGYAPIGMLGDGPLAATLRYNILFVLAHALLAIGGYALVRQLGAGRTGAAVAAVAIAYAPWRLAQEGHLDIISAGGIPLALAMLARGHGWSLRRGLRANERNAGWAAFGWLFAAWQVSLGFSLGVPFLGVLGLILLVLLAGTPILWLRRRSRRRAYQRSPAVESQTAGRQAGEGPPSAGRPLDGQPGAGQLVSGPPDAGQPSAGQPGATRPGASQPGAIEPAVYQLAERRAGDPLLGGRAVGAAQVQGHSAEVGPSGEKPGEGQPAGGNAVALTSTDGGAVDSRAVDSKAAKSRLKRWRAGRVRPALRESDFLPVLGWRLLIIDVLGPLILAGIAALIALPYFHLADTSDSTAQIKFFSPPLWSLLIGPSESRIWGGPHEVARSALRWPAEMSLLPGFVLYALALAGLWFSIWKFGQRILLILALAAAVILTLGTNFFGGRWTYLPLFGHLPASLDLRIPGRLMLWVTLLLGVLAAGAVAEFVRRAEHWSAQRIPPWPAWWLRLATLVPLMLVIAEGWNTTAHPVVPAQPASMRTIISPMLVLPTGAVTDGTVMLWSTTRFQKIANGSGAFAAGRQAQMRTAVAAFPDAASIQYLRSIHVTTVLLIRSAVAGTPWEAAGNTPVDSLGIRREDTPDAVVFYLS